MPYSTAGKNTLLGALPSTIYFSAHSDVPDDVGSNELAGGTYARVSATLLAPSSGHRNQDSNPALINIPGGSTVAFVGQWSAASGGTFYGFGPANGGTTEGYCIGTASTDTLTSFAHGLSNGNRVLVRTGPTGGGSLPGGLSASVLYHVVGAGANTFQLSLTAGGAAVDISADGECYFQKVVVEVYGSNGTLSVNTTDLTIYG
jgi:hypothetical protein